MYISLVRPHLEYAVLFWWPYFAKDIARLEAVQLRARKMIPSLRNKSYEERLARLNLFPSTNVASEENLQSFKIYKGFTNVGANKLLLTDDLPRAGSNGVKPRCWQKQLDYTKFFFTNDVVREWNKLPPSVVKCKKINSFKNKLHRHLLQQGLR